MSLLLYLLIFILEFYCTESIELAKELACPEMKDGYSNKYMMHFDGMNIMHLTRGTLGEQAVLLSKRSFEQIEFIG